MKDMLKNKAYFHLPGLFEFYDFYKLFLPLFYNHGEYFYEWVDIASIYGAPLGYIWSGGRTEAGDDNIEEVIALLREYDISMRLAFSNSLLRKEHLSDRNCNNICRMVEREKRVHGSVIIHSELLLRYLSERYPGLYLVSSTTKVIKDFEKFRDELNRKEFKYTVPDFRLNMEFDKMNSLTQKEKEKVEFLCNECCYIGCKERVKCYENVSRRILGEDCPEHICKSPGASEGYVFSKAMKSPAFIGINDIKDKYLPSGFSNFKIEGRGLGSAILLEFILYYMVKPECQLQVREKIYLNCMLDIL